MKNSASENEDIIKSVASITALTQICFKILYTWNVMLCLRKHKKKERRCELIKLSSIVALLLWTTWWMWSHNVTLATKQLNQVSYKSQSTDLSLANGIALVCDHTS